MQRRWGSLETFMEGMGKKTDEQKEKTIAKWSTHGTLQETVKRATEHMKTVTSAADKALNRSLDWTVTKLQSRDMWTLDGPDPFTASSRAGSSSATTGMSGGTVTGKGKAREASASLEKLICLEVYTKHIARRWEPLLPELFRRHGLGKSAESAWPELRRFDDEARTESSIAIASEIQALEESVRLLHWEALVDVRSDGLTYAVSIMPDGGDWLEISHFTSVRWLRSGQERWALIHEKINGHRRPTILRNEQEYTYD